MALATMALATMALAMTALAMMAAGCAPTGPVSLSVTVRSDLLAGEELATLEISLPDEGLLTTRPVTAAEAEALRIGLGPIEIRDRSRVASRRLLLRALDARGEERLRREVVLDHFGDREITLLLARSCSGVRCEEGQSCVAGRCADSRCVDQGDNEGEEACPEPECELPSDCAPAAACATVTCHLGACVAFPDSLACQPGELCVPEEEGSGCVQPAACEPGFADCDGALANGCEASLRSSPAHCGGCGIACAEGASCEEGRCASAPREVSVAQDRFCSLDEAGGVRCVGVDVGAEEPLAGLIGELRQVAANAYIDCVINHEGRLFCRGRNHGGQLGRGFFGREFTDFAPVQGLPGPVEEVAVGQDHLCARVGGQVWCWGLNGEGELGNDDRDATNLPVQVVGLEEAVSIGVGLDHSCAALASGELWCWGDGSQGRLGLVSDADQLVPVRIPGVVGVVEVALGAIHTCVRTETSAIYCWGENGDGQLGYGAFYDHTFPEEVPGLPRREVLELVAGNRHTCALIRRAGTEGEAAAEGEVWCWGLNEEGQLGELSLENRSEPWPVPGLMNAIDLDASWTNTCAVRARGGVVCWGENEQGELEPGALDPIVGARRVPAL